MSHFVGSENVVWWSDPSFRRRLERVRWVESEGNKMRNPMGFRISGARSIRIPDRF